MTGAPDYVSMSRDKREKPYTFLTQVQRIFVCLMNESLFAKISIAFYEVCEFHLATVKMLMTFWAKFVKIICQHMKYDILN